MKDIAQILLAGLLVLSFYLIGPIGGVALSAASRAVGIEPAAVLVLAIMAIPAVFAMAQVLETRRIAGRVSETQTRASSRDRKAA